MTNFPIEKVRAQCPAAAKSLFFNSAGSSLPSLKTTEIVIDFTKREAEVGGYKLMVDEGDQFNEFYIEAAKLINAEPRNIAFSQSATMAFSQAIYSVEWKQGDVILLSQLEYVSNVLTAKRLQERHGVILKFVDCDQFGIIDLNALEECMKRYTPKALFLTHIPTNIGLVQDVESAGVLCVEHNCIFILDACQSIGQINVDVTRLHCDFLSVTGRKFLRGPRGTGFLYVSDKMIESRISPIGLDLAGTNWIDTLGYSYHKNAKRWELWEKNYSLLLGFTQAIKEINEIGINKIEEYNSTLQKQYREVLASIPGLELLEPEIKNCSIITWKYKNLSKEETLQLVDECNVIYSAAMSESALIDMKKRRLKWSIRFSPHYFNTSQEIETFKDRFLSNISENGLDKL